MSIADILPLLQNPHTNLQHHPLIPTPEPQIFAYPDLANMWLLFEAEKCR